MISRYNVLKHFDFIIIDIVSLQGALFLARQFRKDTFTYLNDNYSILALIVLCAFFTIALFWNVYSGILLRSWWDEIKGIIALNAGIFVVVMMYFFMAKTSIVYSRVVMSVFPIISSTFMLIGHMALRGFITAKNKKKSNPFYLIVHSNNAEYCLEHFFKNEFLGDLEGIILYDDVEISYIRGFKVIGHIKDIKDFIAKGTFRRVYAYGAGEQLEDVMETLALMEVPVYKILRPVHKSSISYKIDKLGDVDVLSIREKEVPIGLAILKRFSDIFFSIVCMILSLPISLVVAVMIKIQDGGPVLYTAARVGLNGKKIKMYKFRTMMVDSDKMEDSLSEEERELFHRNGHKLRYDPRVTKLGRFLRRYSIDEIPQFFNILRGDMSFVGPRPVSEEETYYYGDKRNLFLSVKPGLTGYWQTHGRSNITYENEARQNMELYYIENFSWYMDMKILFLTVRAVISGDGAL